VAVRIGPWGADAWGPHAQCRAAVNRFETIQTASNFSKPFKRLSIQKGPSRA
jgi:hypothetical protein